jgi:hypothetical protein
MSHRSVGTKWVTRLAVAATSASIGLVATGAVLSPAAADTPVKVGWWNFASGGGQAAPAPDTNPGGLRVGVSSSQPLAFGAVEYQLPKDGSATLELAVTHITSSASGPVVNAILACPTKDDSWKAGDNQDASTAPAYDCDRAYSVGRLSADQATMTFQVNGSADITDGVLSLAIVPAHSTAIPYVGTDPGTGTDLTAPFVVDFDKPGSNSFVSDDTSSSSDSSSSGSSSGSSSAPPPPSASGSTGTSSTPSFPAPPASGDVSVPASTTTDAGSTPVVAPQQQAGSGGTAPAAALAPAKADNSRHDLLLVLLILLLFAILYTQNMQQRAPRRVAAASSPGQPATEAATLPIAYPVGLAPRGLGRFNKPRAEAARPLI